MRHIGLLGLLMLLMLTDVHGQRKKASASTFDDAVIQGLRLGTAPTALIAQQQQIQINGSMHLGGRFTLNATQGIYTDFGTDIEQSGFRSRLYAACNAKVYSYNMYLGLGLQYRKQEITQSEVFDRYNGSYFQELEYTDGAENFGIPAILGVVAHIKGDFYLDVAFGLTIYQEFDFYEEGLPPDATLQSREDILLREEEFVFANLKLQYRIK